MLLVKEGKLTTSFLFLFLALALATRCIRVIALSTAVFVQTVYAMTVRYRGALVGVIYHKTLRLASHASEFDHPSGGPAHL